MLLSVIFQSITGPGQYFCQMALSLGLSGCFLTVHGKHFWK
jgi:hypothetical protein